MSEQKAPIPFRIICLLKKKKWGKNTQPHAYNQEIFYQIVLTWELIRKIFTSKILFLTYAH